MLKNKKAFSLIELLIVITIIGILAVVMLPKITQGPARARDAQRISDIADIANAIEMYKQDNTNYPGTAGTLVMVDTTLGISSYFDTTLPPVDPVTTNVVTGLTTNGKYGYRRTATGFQVIANTETDKFSTGYYDLSSLATIPTAATSPSTTGNNNVYAYVK